MSLNDSFARLRDFASAGQSPTEQCDLCSVGLPSGHEHLLLPETGELKCVCSPCAFLFSGDGATSWRRVPRVVRALPGLDLDAAAMGALGIPVSIAFFVRTLHAAHDGSTLDGPSVVCRYPGPAGIAESRVEPFVWKGLVAQCSDLDRMPLDVVACLLRVTRGETAAYMVSIDHCFELVGTLRKYWRGVSGGQEVEQVLGDFFERLRREVDFGR